MNEYKDPGFGFTIHYPENWKQLGTIGKALFTESQDMATKFIDPTKGIEGGRVMVEAIAYEGKTPEAIIEAGKAFAPGTAGGTEPPGGGHRRRQGVGEDPLLDPGHHEGENLRLRDLRPRRHRAL